MLMDWAKMQWIFKKRLESRLKLPPPFLLIFPDYCGQCRLKWKKPSPVTYRTQLIATIWTDFNEYSRFKGFLPSNSSFQTTSRFGNQICRRSDSWIRHLHLQQRVKKTETSNIRRIQISDYTLHSNVSATDFLPQRKDKKVVWKPWIRFSDNLSF